MTNSMVKTQFTPNHLGGNFLPLYLIAFCGNLIAHHTRFSKRCLVGKFLTTRREEAGPVKV